MPPLFVIAVKGRLTLLAIVFLLGAAASAARAGTPPDFQRGNTLYANGKYADAATAYESAVRTGSTSANLFYDLGNTYFRLGNRGKAILNYQRTLLLEPAHAEARANLAFVQGRTNQRGGGGDSWLARTFNLSEVDFWPILAAAAGWLGLFCVVAGAFSRGRRVAASACCLAVCAGGIEVSWWLDDGLKNASRAIVVAEQVPGLYSPADSSKVITKLAAGSEVRLLSEQGAWVYAQIPDGSRVWLAAANVEKVVPPQT